jgi:hypothetical protein
MCRRDVPAELSSHDRRGNAYKSCDSCRLKQRERSAICGNARCGHGKRPSSCLVCRPASALGQLTLRRAQGALRATTLPLSCAQLLGCSTRVFAMHIMSLFIDGMSLSNYGTVWELDHVVPLLQRVNGARPLQIDVISRFRFTNVRPVFIEEHRAKTRLERTRRWVEEAPTADDLASDASTVGI